ncbi:MAG TPA: Rha family transcriptional regulator [Candidatus Desulfovibrio intestinigallinarum]|nr:Rha family transcriptional regulator [Candidatus Desulfovibrio intestinigallinarum]
MAENSLSQAVSFINDNSTMEVGLTAEGQPAVRSDIVAYHFKRSHKNVLRDIAKLRSKCPESFHRLNFEPMFIETQIGNGATRKDRAYLLTRDGFSLLVMGFTGAEAVRWKLRYIEAFNALEAAALAQRAELARESGYLQGLDAGRASVAPLLDEMRGETARLFWKLGPTQKRRLRRVMRYHAMGLSQREIGRLLDIPRRSVQELLKAAEALGLPTEKPARPVQGNLLEVEA